MSAPTIRFLCDPALIDAVPPPAPAAKFLPVWFRDLPRAMGMPDAHGLPGLTVRACLPVADVMGLGWIIPLPFDIWTERDASNGTLQFHWSSDCPCKPLEAHHPGQIGAGKPPFERANPLKFINPWRVVLPAGWSANFTHPFNHFELPFQAFNGAVDCDGLEVPVNVPFLWTGGSEPQHLPAGTPMVQVIPYQRSAQIRTAEIRAETTDESAARHAGLTRKYGEESVYAREWRRHNEKST